MTDVTTENTMTRKSTRSNVMIRKIDVIIKASLSNGADGREMNRIQMVLDHVEKAMGEKYELLKVRDDNDQFAMKRVITLDVDKRDVWPSKVEELVIETVDEHSDVVDVSVFSTTITNTAVSYTHLTLPTIYSV